MGAATICLALISAAEAQTLEDLVTPTTLAAARPIPWIAPSIPSLKEVADPEFIRREPQRAAAFLESDPARLDPARMTPEAALQASEVLIQGGRAFAAERLLHAAHARWADRGDVCLAYARALLHLGQWEAVPRALDPVMGGAESRYQVYAHYLLALALGERPPSPENSALVAEHLEFVLNREPNFRSHDGHTAEDLRAALQKIREPKPAKAARKR